MSIVTSIFTALFIIAIVFLVLVLLWFILRVFGIMVPTFERAKSQMQQGNGAQPEKQV